MFSSCRCKCSIVLAVLLFSLCLWQPAGAQTKTVRLSIATGGTGECIT